MTLEGWVPRINGYMSLIQLFDEQGDGPFTIPYRDIVTIRFTGKDTAAGNSEGGAARGDRGRGRGLHVRGHPRGGRRARL